MITNTAVAFYVLTFIILFLALLLNSLGIYLLCAPRIPISGPNLILVNLSVVKILLTITECVLCLLELNSRGDNDREYQVFDIINGGLYGVNDLIVITLTTDRFVATLFPLLYNMKVTKKRLMAAVGVSWLVGTGGIVPFFFANYNALYDIYYKIVFSVLDGTIIVLAIVTYGTILKTLLATRNNLSRFSTQSRSQYRRQHGKFFFVAGLIIASFIAFVAIPDAVYTALVIVKGNDDEMIEKAIGLVWSLYLIADPLIYVFLQRQTKRRLKQLLFGRQDSSVTFDPTQRTVTRM